VCGSAAAAAAAAAASLTSLFHGRCGPPAYVVALMQSLSAHVALSSLATLTHGSVVLLLLLVQTTLPLTKLHKQSHNAQVEFAALTKKLKKPGDMTYGDGKEGHMLLFGLLLSCRRSSF
jgi:hypothetical protein